MEVDDLNVLRLPWELLDIILEELGRNVGDVSSRDALCNCALVCHSFHLRASGYLFSDIVVSKDSFQKIPRRLKELHSIFSQNETIAPRVRSFVMDTALNHTRTDMNIYYISDLPKIIPRMTSLLHFAWHNRGSPFSWTSLSEDIVVALRSLLSCASLESLGLEGIRDLTPTDLALCTRLKHLHLLHVDPPKGLDPVALPASPLRLQTLVDFNSSDTLSDTYDDAVFSNLKSLSVWMRHDAQVASAWRLMQMAARTLEVLNIPELSHFRYPTLIPGLVNIGVLSNLRSITMGCRIATLDHVVFPMGICGLLRTATAPTRLQTIAITLDWVDCQVGSEEARFLHDPGWTALDDTLAQTYIFPELKTVALTLRMGYGWIEDKDQQPPHGVYVLQEKLKKSVAGLLSRVAASGAVKVNIQLLLYKSKYASGSSMIM